MGLPPMLAFAAPSGTGKTTLIEQVIAVLSADGLRVGVLKHDAHRLKLDTPGKDTWRFRQSGAWRAVIASADQLGVFSAVSGELSLGGLVQEHLARADLVLVEGFRRSGLPTIRVDRSGGPGSEGWAPPHNVVAWASDRPVETSLPVLPLDGRVVAGWIREWIGSVVHRRSTLVLPVADEEAIRRAPQLADRFGALAESVLVVRAPDLPAVDLPSVPDLRPELGPLGALLTALATVDTPDVLFVGSRHLGEEPELLRSVRDHEPRADLCVLRRDGFPEPLFARYGHPCLSAIKGALLGGERKMDGWWGQVRVAWLK